MSLAVTSSRMVRPGSRCTGSRIRAWPTTSGRRSRPSYDHPFDPQALPVAAALLARYTELLAGGVPAASPGYLWRYAWRHAASAGPAGLDLLRDLAAGEPRSGAGCRHGCWGDGGPSRALGLPGRGSRPAEEAVTLYRELAAANPAFLPDLAVALNNLGIRYSEVGRRQDALAPAEEAVTSLPGAGRRQPRLPPRPRRRAEQPRQPLQRGGPPPGRPGPRRGSRHPLPGAGRRQPRLPPRPRQRAEQPRHPLQRGGPPPGRPGPHRGSRQLSTGSWPPPTPPTSPTSPWR